ncbi:MAG: NifU family protein [Bacteroidota bacterium]
MSKEEKSNLIKRIETALDTVRPHLAVDGGNVELVDITDDLVVQVKWLGNCQNCSMTAMTMKAGIEQAVKSHVPEINSVVAINGIAVG